MTHGVSLRLNHGIGHGVITLTVRVLPNVSRVLCVHRVTQNMNDSVLKLVSVLKVKIYFSMCALDSGFHYRIH